MNRFIQGLVLVLLVAVPSVSFAALDTNLKYGSSGSSVKELQEFLTTQGVYSGPITGNFYSLTLAAVKAFQRKESIVPVSGYWGPLSQKKAQDSLDLSASNSDEQIETGTIAAIPPKDDTAAKIQALTDQVNALSQSAQQIAKNTTPVPAVVPPPSKKDIIITFGPKDDATASLLVDAVVLDDAGQSVMETVYFHTATDYVCKCGDEVHFGLYGPDNLIHYTGRIMGVGTFLKATSISIDVPSLNLRKTVPLPAGL